MKSLKKIMLRLMNWSPSSRKLLISLRAISRNPSWTSGLRGKTETRATEDTDIRNRWTRKPTRWLKSSWIWQTVSLTGTGTSTPSISTSPTIHLAATGRPLRSGGMNTGIRISSFRMIPGGLIPGMTFPMRPILLMMRRMRKNYAKNRAKPCLFGTVFVYYSKEI